ncbi:hypothetical protein WDU94_000074 [Cyamophila willieti]
MEARFPMHSTFLSTYPDLIAASIVLLMCALISYGVRESTRINSILTFLNLGTVVTIVLSGSTKLNFANWTIPRQNIPARYRSKAGNGGFFPFGVSGVMAGAAKCFFGYVGFDAIATTGEEAKNPRRNIPLSILISLSVVFVCYLCISVVLTLVIPYYEQDAEAPFLHIFDVFGWSFMKWLVSVGSLFALLTGMFGALFPLPRILYSMSRDGLLYNSFAYVSPLTHTPIVSSVATGLLTAVLSAIFKLDQLVDMLSIGTLLAYTIVALSVLLLRYSEDLDEEVSDDDAAARYSDPVIIQTIDHTMNRDKVKSESEDGSPAIYHQSNTEIYTPHYDDFHVTSSSSFSQINNESYQNTDDLSNAQKTNASIIRHDTGIVKATHLESERYHPAENLSNASVYTINRPELTSRTKLNENPVHIEVTDESIKSRQGQVSNNYSKSPGGHSIKPVLSTSGSSLSVRALLNLNSTPRVTAASQFTSKVCIYMFIGLTIVMCLTLNAMLDVDLNLDNDEIVLPPVSGNDTLALQVREKKINKLQNYYNLALRVGENETNSLLELRVRENETGRLLAIPMSLNEKYATLALSNDSLALLVSSSFGSDLLFGLDPVWSCKVVAFVLLILVYLTTLLCLSRQAQNVKALNFRVPLVPLIPCLSIFLNTYLMVNLDPSTWVRFVVWMTLGLFIYFSYGISHSKLKDKKVS